MKVAPQEVFDLFITDAAAGATVGVQIVNFLTNVVVTPRRTTEITEYPAGSVRNPSSSSVYKTTFIAPSANGTYFIWWDVNGAFAGEDLIVDGPGGWTDL